MSDFEEALERLHKGAFEYGDGLANHGPMAVEALAQLGHPALIPAFTDLYAPRVPPRTEGRPLSSEERALALGRIERGPDWLATYESALAASDWRATLCAELPVLVEGLFAGATHGLIRTAHAVRSLEAEDTPTRRRELAMGLAYWAARHQRLPARPGARGAGSGRKPIDVLSTIGPVPAERRGPFLIFEAARVLDEEAAFIEAVESVDFEAAPLETTLSLLCREAAGLYLANLQARVPYVHGVTAPAALRILLPHLRAAEVSAPDLATRAVGEVFQAVAGIHALYAALEGASSAPAEADPELAALAESPAEIRYRAACSLEEHAIKLAEACLREDAIEADVRLRLAAAEAAIRLDPPRGRHRC